MPLTNSATPPCPRAHTGQLLLRLADDVLDAMDASLAPCGISESRISLLLLFAGLKNGEGNLKPSRIAEILGITRASVTKQLVWLENSKLIKRNTNSTDQRACDVTITQEGFDMLAKAMPAYWDTCIKYTENLSEDETAFLFRVLKKIHR